MTVPTRRLSSPWVAVTAGHKPPNFKYNSVESQKRHNTPPGCVQRITFQALTWRGLMRFTRWDLNPVSTLRPGGDPTEEGCQRDVDILERLGGQAARSPAKPVRDIFGSRIEQIGLDILFGHLGYFNIPCIYFPLGEHALAIINRAYDPGLRLFFSSKS